MDEPQEGMDTPNMQRRLAAFNPLFKLRYSATHRNPKNIINRLTPYDAYNQGLVKKISVLSIHESNTQSHVAMKFRRVNLSRRDPTASVQLNVRLRSGEIKDKVVTLKRHDDLAKKRTIRFIMAGFYTTLEQRIYLVEMVISNFSMVNRLTREANSEVIRRKFFASKFIIQFKTTSTERRNLYP